MISFSLLSLLFFFLTNSLHAGTRRLNDYGNFKNTTYFELEENKNKKKNKKKRIDTLEDFVEINRIFDGCMRGMKFIKEVKNFKIGPTQKNKFEGIEVDIEGFFIDKTEITVKEYKKFLSILKYYLDEKKKNNDVFGLSDNDVMDKYLKKDDNQTDDSFKVHVEWYLKFRKELLDKLSEEYINTMQPDFEVFGNDDFAKKYFNEETYEDYPIVGIYFFQTEEFNKWRTFYINEYYLKESKRQQRCFIKFSLPKYTQYTYAASCGDELGLYGFGTVNVHDKNSVVKANFSYGQYKNNDIGLKSVYSYSANEWDLYDMSGNVYEWLDDNEENYLSSQKDKKNEELKMITGGSWLTPLTDLEVGKYRNAHILETRKDLGFRSVAEIVF